MSKRIFTKDQIRKLNKNKNVDKCSVKAITYANNFKIKAVRQWQTGLPPQEIFRQAGFDINIIGKYTPKDSLLRWRKIFKAKGSQGLANSSKGKSGGRKKIIKHQNDKEKIKYLETEVAYLKAENAFLAKLRKKS